MGRRMRAGEWVPLFVEITPEMKQELQDSADEDERSLTAQVKIAIGQFLRDRKKAKPKVRARP